MSADDVPHADSRFLEWAKNFYHYALAHHGIWQTPSPRPAIEAPLAAFTTACECARINSFSRKTSIPESFLKGYGAFAADFPCFLPAPGDGVPDRPPSGLPQVAGLFPSAFLPAPMFPIPGPAFPSPDPGMRKE
ncbi:MAG: hypothetical protein LBP86_07350 [Azoarcus sp.]|jgi:hypothetical protein|nr:hypothetical protein [Azoarcus sp.]